MSAPPYGTKSLVLVLALCPVAAATAEQPPTASAPVTTRPGDVISTAAAPTRPYPFSVADEQLLDEIEYACFQYFWKEVGRPALLVKDRLKAPVSSVAAVGFQLSSLPIGVERGWITREAGRERAETILRTLIGRPDNRKFGVLLHYPDMNTGGLSHEGFEILASTVDHALFLAGALTAGEYFGDEVGKLAERFADETNWRAYAVGPGGRVSMGWKPEDPTRMDGPGQFLDMHWWLASDEERLIHFLGAAASRAEYALAPAEYYRLKRVVERHGEMEPYAVSWPGALFTYFFSHCWIDFASLGPDEPGRFGVDAPRIDWWENSRRAVLTHRARCLERTDCTQRLGQNGWGLSACVGRDGYIVPEIQPNLRDADQWYDCTIAPYAAGSAIMFTPAESVAALRAFRELTGPDGRPWVWRDPTSGGYGLADAFCLAQNYVSDDYVGIDHGPLLLAIENARTGLVWKLFMRHPVARRAVERLAAR